LEKIDANALTELMDLLQKHFDIALETPDGIKKLRGLVHTLAMQGKLVTQNPNDQPASELLQKIEADKARLAQEGKLRNQESLPIIKAEEIPHQLPQGWEWARIGTIAMHNTGKTLDGGRNSGALKEYITTSNLYWGYFSLESLRKMPFRPEEIDRFSATKGDLLLCEGGEAGRAAVWDKDFDICFQNHIHRVRFLAGIDPYFGFRFFRKLDYTDEISNYRKGVGISSMSGKTLSTIVFPLPPLAEQKRIVAKIDQLMALCDRLEAERNTRDQKRVTVHTAAMNRLLSATDKPTFDSSWQFITKHFNQLYSVTPNIAELKKAILQLAVMGKLVSQDPEDESAAELIAGIEGGNSGRESKRAESIEDQSGSFPFPCPDNWKWTKVQSILEKGREISYGVIKLGDEPRAGGVSTLRCSDVKPGFIDLSCVRRVSEEIEGEYARTRLLGGEILINIRGTLGGVAEVPETLRGFNVAREVAVIPIAKVMSPRFIMYLMLSPFFWKSIQSNLRGIAYKGLNLGTLREFSVPIPPIAEQKRIVAKIDQLMALCDALKKQIGAATEKKTAILNAVLAEV
jgi:type I restriction enzyme S subunit